ncbi:hypothetical protein CW705_07125 [Candidatus Bathyarchaeota archaeon]|nr:MAG: hypothetical protein CW705_07125 [Candidatus Bathyarchaeota archaeon]
MRGRGSFWEMERIKAIFCFLTFLVLVSSLVQPVNPQIGMGRYTYYGFIPSRIYCFNPNLPEDYSPLYSGPDFGPLHRRPPKNNSEILHVRDYGVLLVVGNWNSTHCWLYELPTNRLLRSFSLNRFELKAIKLPNETFFKLVSDKIVSAVIKGGAFVNRVVADTYNADVSTYYLSTNGSYVGKEFIFPATLSEEEFTPYRIFSIDSAKVEVYENGSLLKSFDLPANSVVSFYPKNGSVCYVKSTGYIMVSAFHFAESCFIPSVKGGFVGKVFYASGARRQGGRGEAFFRSYTYISGVEDAKARIFDVKGGKWVREVEIPAGSASTLKTDDLSPATWETSSYILYSDNPVTLMYVSNSTVEGGVSIFGLKAGQEAVVVIPEGESYIFAAEDCLVEIGDLKYRLATDQIKRIPQGVYPIRTTGTIIVEVVDLTEYRGLLGFAEALPPVQTIDFSPSGLKLRIPQEETMQNYILIGVGVAVALAVVLFMLWRRR